MSKEEKVVGVWSVIAARCIRLYYTTYRETRFVLTNGFNGLLFVSCVTTVCSQQNNLETICGSHMYFPENCLPCRDAATSARLRLTNILFKLSAKSILIISTYGNNLCQLLLTASIKSTSFWRKGKIGTWYEIFIRVIIHNFV